MRGSLLAGRTWGAVLAALTVIMLVAPADAVEEDVGCSYFAPAALGTADAADSPPAPIPSNTGEALAAGCGDAFDCADACTLGMLFGFTGTGIVSGEVEIIGSYFTPDGFGVVFRAFHTSCGPEVAIPRGGCFGSFSTTLPALADLDPEPEPGVPIDYLLVCKADGVVAVQVNGHCTGVFH